MIYLNEELLYKYIMDQVTDDNNCFACGVKNPVGLKLKFTFEEKRALSEVNIVSNYQGWEGIVHGGIISTMLDEAMVKAATVNNVNCVTAEINVKFKIPCKIGKDYKLSGEIVGEKRNVLFAVAKLEDSGGKVVAEAKGKLFIIDGIN